MKSKGKFKFRLIPHWKKAWKLFSMQAMALSSTMLATYTALHDKLQDALPVELVVSVAVGILILGMVGRITSQDAKN